MRVKMGKIFSSYGGFQMSKITHDYDIYIIFLDDNFLFRPTNNLLQIEFSEIFKRKNFNKHFTRLKPVFISCKLPKNLKFM